MAEYIEREPLLRYLNDIWLSAAPTDTMFDDDRELAVIRCMGLNDAMDAVREAPAADVRPVVRGKWKAVRVGGFTPGGNSLHICSECGWEFGTHRIYPDYNFCPNCGADMREES